MRPLHAGVNTVAGVDVHVPLRAGVGSGATVTAAVAVLAYPGLEPVETSLASLPISFPYVPVSYTHLRAHETPEHLVCRLRLEKKKQITGIYTSRLCTLIYYI